MLIKNTTASDRVKAFKLSLHARGLTLGRICRFADVDRAHFSLVLSERRTGKKTWKRVEPFLTIEERQILGRPVPSAEQMFHVEQQTPKEESEFDPERVNRLPSVDELAEDFA